LNRFAVYGREILILSAIFLVSSLAIDLISPIWPIFIKDSLGASMTQLGLVFSISNAVAAMMQIPSGLLSDKYGRRRLHVLGTLLAVFPPLMYSLANNLNDLVPWVILAGFGTGLYIPVRWAIVADASSSKTMASAYSWTNISWLIGSTTAPFIGGVIADLYGIRFPFLASFVLRFTVFPLALLLGETKRKTQARVIEHDAKANAVYPYATTMILFSLVNIVQGFGIGVSGPVIPVFVVSNFSVDFAFVGMLYSIGFGLASIIVQVPGGKCSDRFDRRSVMFVTFLTSAPFFLLFAYSRSPLELIVFMFVSNATLNLSWSAFQTLLMDATPSSKWGFINGVSATTFWIGTLTGNIISGILWDGVGALAPFYASALTIALSAVFPLLLRETRTKPKQASNPDLL